MSLYLRELVYIFSFERRAEKQRSLAAHQMMLSQAPMVADELVSSRLSGREVEEARLSLRRATYLSSAFKPRGD
jgi:hypothetical protein